MSKPNDERYTPQRYINLAKQVLGQIDLDPASCPKAQEIVRARHYFTTDSNGLERPWYGRIWLNPPYSRPLLTKFIDKAIHEFRVGNVTDIIILTGAGTETVVTQKLLKYDNCFLDHRIQFMDKKGVVMKNPKGASIFTYIGQSNHYRFKRVFETVGIVK